MSAERDPESQSTEPHRLELTQEEIIQQLHQRLDFLELTEEDAGRLRVLTDVFEQDAERFVEDFYDHLFKFEETAAFLRNEDVVQGLKKAQRDHFLTLLESQWDEHYVARRWRVGEVHAHVGIEPQIFLGAYNQYIQHWFEHFEPLCDEASRPHFETLRSLLRAVLLDVGLTLDAYFQESTQNMRKALNMYWNANNELRQFAQLASHDLKTPLATVTNLCDEAIDEFGDRMPAGAVELIEQAKGRAYRMSTMIDELLAATIPTDRVASAEPVSSSKVIAEAVERVAPEMEKKGIELVITGTLPVVLGDKARLREVFANLLSNAAKFIDKTPGQIHISADVNENECILYIEDNGPGIPPEELKRIFSPFLRLRAHQNVPGSGLGLYFTRNLVQQLQGRIWAESTPGEGSRFCVALRRESTTAAEG